MAIPKYVKFERGTIAAYNKLTNKDKDTLYFIYTNEDKTSGKLYLGDCLIAGDGSGVDLSSSSISELSDVITTNVGQGSFLVYDSTSSKWKSQTLAEVAESIITTVIDTNQFQFTEVDGSKFLSLKGFNDADNGTYLTKVNGVVSWETKPDLTALSTSVSNLTTEVNNLKSASGLTYTKANTINDIDVSADSSKNKIFLVPNNSSGGNKFDEFMVIDGALESLGTVGEVDFSNYVTNTDFETLETTVTELSGSVSNLQTDYNSLSSDVGTLQTNYNTLSNDVSTLGTTISTFIDTTAPATYVTLTKYNSEVGNLSSLIHASGDENSTLVDEINSINERLEWVEMTE